MDCNLTDTNTWAPARRPLHLPQAGFRALLAASVALPPLAPLCSPAWAQLGSSANVPQQNVFGPRILPGTPVSPLVGTPAVDPVADAPAAPPTDAAPADAIRVLLDQASFWRTQGLPERSLESLNRVLQLDPNNPDALAVLASIQAERGDIDASKANLQRLRRVRPTDPRIEAVETSIRTGKISETDLAEARDLVRQAKYADAIKVYQRAFKGTVPPTSYAVEYYQTLGGTDGGFDDAREGLGRQVITNPDDLRLQLAYAQLLTYDGGGREEGIQRLQILASQPAVSSLAKQSLRQALLWLPDTSSSMPTLNVYLQQNPTDAEIQQKRQTVRVRGEGTDIRERGFAAIEKGKQGDLPTAERAFKEALEINPNDADATFGLGLVRLFQGREDESKELIKRSLQLGPSDPESLQAMLKNLDDAKTARDPVAEARVAAYAQLQQNHTIEAEQLFRKALELKPEDGDSMVGLGWVRLRQGKTEEGKQFLLRAQQMGTSDPQSVERALASFNRSYASTGGNRGRGGRNGGDFGAAIRRQYAQVASLTTRGNFDDAEKLLRRLMGRRPAFGNYVQLGDIQARAGRYADAEASFRRAMAMNPRSSAPRVGLAGLLLRQGRDAEAETLYAQVSDAAGRREIGRVRAERLRAQAQGINDPIAQAGLYRAAAIADPGNPWLRLELASALRKQGRAAEARQVMLDVGRSDSPDAIKAALIYAQSSGDVQQANQLIVRIPERSRTPEIRQAQQRINILNDVDQASRAGSAETVRSRLLAMAAQPDPTGVRGAEIARVLTDLKDTQGAREAITALLASTRAPTAEQRLAYSGALLNAGFDQDAEAVVGSIDRSRLPTADRPQLAGVEDGIAIRQSDRLRVEGRVANAYDELAPRLAANPDNPGVNMALARLYQANRKPAEALAINESLLQRNPNNLDVRRALVGAAIQAGELTRAREVADETVQIFPNDPRTYVIAADVARARGNNGEALRDLRTARDLRLQQLGTSDDGRRRSAGIAARPISAVADAGTGAAPLGRQAAGDQAAGALPYKAELAAAQIRLRLPGTDLSSGQEQYPAEPEARPVYANLMLGDTGSEASPRFGRAGAIHLTGGTDTLGANEAAIQSAASLPARALDAAPSTSFALRARRFSVERAAPALRPATATAPRELDGERSRPLLLNPSGSGVEGNRVSRALRFGPEARAASYPGAAAFASAPPPVRPIGAGLPGVGTVMTATLGQSRPQPDLVAAASPKMVPNAPYRAEQAQAVLNGGGGAYQNPFREGPSGAASNDFQPLTPGILGTGPLSSPPSGTGGLAPVQPVDPLLASIDQDIGTIQDVIAPSVQVGLGLRGRSGQDGLTRLTELTVPMEAQYSPGGVGRLKLQVTPTYLDANGIDNTAAVGFGTNPLRVAQGQAALTPSRQNAAGSALDLAYSYRFATVDLGTTPLGFQEQNVVGGVELVPEVLPNTRLRLTGERRAVSDSVLSFAGARDRATGLNFGGVTRTRGYAQVEYSPGALALYAGGGGGVVDGKNVASNSYVEFGVGGSYPVFRTPTKELRAGLSLSYLDYDKNLGGSTLGQGGYFSPSDYFAAVIPLSFRHQVTDRFRYQLGGSFGIQTFKQKGTALFPNDPVLQAQLVQLASANTGLLTRNTRTTDTSLVGGVSGEVEYKLTRNVTIGARAGFQRAGDFNEGTGLVYARYVFTGAS